MRMNQEKIINFLEFYLESEIEGLGEGEEIESISKELEEAGIDAVASEEEILGLIKTAKAEAKIESGKSFKQKYYELLNNMDSLLSQMEKEEPELATAFRKLEGSANIEDILDDEDKMKILEFLKKKKE